MYFFNMSATHDSAQPLGVSGCFLHHKEGERQRAPCTVAGPWSCLLSPNSLPPTPHSGSSQPSAGFAASDTSGSCRIPAVGPPCHHRQEESSYLAGWNKTARYPACWGREGACGLGQPRQGPNREGEKTQSLSMCQIVCACIRERHVMQPALQKMTETV